MLELIDAQSLETDVIRLANQQQNEDFLRAQGLDDQDVQEMLDFLSSRNISDNPEDLFDDVFKPKLQLLSVKPTRFSDGAYSVFYSSLESETAQAEVRHSFPKYAGNPTTPRTAYYSRISCRFDGSVKDLRPMHIAWPGLTHDSDYSFCNDLGAESVASDLDGLLTPSGRRSDGTNLPVFKRRSISNPVVHGQVAMTLDPSSGDIAVIERDVDDT